MKKILCILLVLLLSISFVGCSKTTADEDIPLVLVNETEDMHGNIIHQIYYNKTDGNYLILEYTYQLHQGDWVCVHQQTIVYQTVNCEPYPDANYCGPDLGLPYTYE